MSHSYYYKGNQKLGKKVSSLFLLPPTAAQLPPPIIYEYDMQERRQRLRSKFLLWEGEEGIVTFWSL